MAVIPGIFILTGTRSSLLLLLGPLILVFFRTDVASRSTLRLLLLGVVSTLVLVAILPTLSSSVKWDRLTTRLDSIGEIVGNPNSDNSYDERQAQTIAAWDQFLAHPVTGTGPGVPIPWTARLRTVDNSFNLDTGVSFLTKFGVLGVLIVLLWYVGFKQAWRRIGPDLGDSPIRYAFLAYLIQIGSSVLLKNPIEDKGLSFTILLLLTLVTVTLNVRSKGSQDASDLSNASLPKLGI